MKDLAAFSKQKHHPEISQEMQIPTSPLPKAYLSISLGWDPDICIYLIIQVILILSTSQRKYPAPYGFFLICKYYKRAKSDIK